MTFPISPEDQAYLVDRLSALQRGDEAFYGQLYPDVYPSDAEVHQAYKHNHVSADYYYRERNLLFGRFITSIADTGVRIKRLRTLPAGPNEDIAPMMAMCRVAADSGEDVRVCRLDQQLGRMALDDIDGVRARNLLAQVPRSSFWSLHHRNQFGKLSVKSVAVINYEDDGTYPGIAEYNLPGKRVQKFVKFWRSVHDDPRQSRPIDDWYSLYDKVG